MAKDIKRTQAERVASDSKKKKTIDKSTIKDDKKTPKDDKARIDQQEEKTKIPVRFITSSVFISLFIILLIAAFQSDGIILSFFKNIISGLIGSTGYVILIPVLLYLFYIHAFSGPRPVKMRTVCIVSFLIICGCISHLALDPQHLEGQDFFGVLSGLYTGGIEGTTGGLICGIITRILTPLFETIITCIILIVAAILTLLGAMQITIPSIIRAFHNRPRADWEDEEKEVRQEPATVVVNHIATKRIEYKEKKRSKAQAAAEAEAKEKDRAKEIFGQIDSDVTDPVAAAAIPVSSDTEAELITGAVEKPKKKEKTATETEPISTPSAMPPLDLDEYENTEDNLDLSAIAPIEIEKKKVTAAEARESAVEVAVEIAAGQSEEKQEYKFPPIDLLKLPSGEIADGTSEMRENSHRLNETLASFKIEAHIINVTRGPSVTRYEVELEKGVRLSKLTSAADDIALSLGATGVRIAAIPGKISVVGIEVPNKIVNTVSLREVIDSQEFEKAKSKSSFAVGKDIGGSCIVGNIAKLPHMLIAGTTGSGKSVCMNSIIISLLYKATPDEVKLIMVDPKMVELVNYNGIPHLLIPVVTDPKKAAGSLQWAVSEMMRRYKAMSDAGVRDLESYNGIMESQQEPQAKMPQVVVVIDELADLMLVAAKEVEESICRIAQMGRAAGIHLVIATQRPSADVITGLMKANIPSRIAFSVASAMESRIILDTQGAEKLVGKGDMLYAPIGSGKPKRVQGCFVSDAEVEAVAAYVKSNFTTDYDESVMEEIERKAQQAGTKQAAPDPEPSTDEIAGDDMLAAAVDVILETGQASVSMLQRRLKLGYARAARIVDEMEELGIVGPFMGSKPRAILVTKEQWENMKSGQPSQLDFDDLEDGSELDSSQDI